MVDYFITYSMGDKLALLQGLTETILTGQMRRVKTSRDSETEFYPTAANELTYQRLCDSIANDPNFDATDPIQAAAAGNARPAITKAVFGGHCWPEAF